MSMGIALVTKLNVSPIYVPDALVPTTRKKYWVSGVRPVSNALTAIGVNPEPADWDVVVSPKLTEVPQSKWYMVAQPLGLTVPFNVAEVTATSVAARV